MKRLFVLLIIISVTPWATGQVGNTPELWITGNDTVVNKSQKGIENFAITTEVDDCNNSTIVQR